MAALEGRKERERGRERCRGWVISYVSTCDRNDVVFLNEFVLWPHLRDEADGLGAPLSRLRAWAVLWSDVIGIFITSDPYASRKCRCYVSMQICVQQQKLIVMHSD